MPLVPRPYLCVGVIQISLEFGWAARIPGMIVFRAP